MLASSHLSLSPDLISGDPSYFNRFAGKTGDWLLMRQTNCFLRLLCDVLKIPEISLKLSFNEGIIERLNPLQGFKHGQSLIEHGKSKGEERLGSKAVAFARSEVRHLVASGGDTVMWSDKLSSGENLSNPQNPLSGLNVLDVGGNHGQVAIPLGILGAKVTVVQSEGIGKNSQIYRFIETFSKVHKDLITNVVIEEVPNLGNLTKINSDCYDLVTCFRILPHVNDPQVFLQTLMGKSKLATFIEYPNLQSINILSSLMFALKKRIEKDTRPFVLFKNRDFRQPQFSLEALNQCSLPLALHRYLGKPRLSELSEALLTNLGVTKVFGSPTIAAIRRH